jgi:CRP-like cAMP-binding protein
MTASPAIEAQFSSVLQMLVPINGLSVPRRQQLLTQSEVLTIRRGSYVFHEGDKDGYAFFLLDGSLELFAGQQLVKRISGGSADAIHPLAQLQPRQLSARALSEARVLRMNRDLLDKLIALDGASDQNDIKVNETEVEEDGDWMTRMLQSELFSRVPAANIQQIFACLDPIEHKAGDVILKQGDVGDFYYVIQTGRCQVSRRIPNGKVPIKLAELGPGDTFGEEALVANATRNASVTMITDGIVMRLTKHDFAELIKKPLLSEISHREAQRLVTEHAAIWLDVRFPEEHREGSIEGSLNLPLNTLRMHAERLDRDKVYVVCCDTGVRSAVGAFLLSERGFDVHFLHGGLLKQAEASKPASAPPPKPRPNPTPSNPSATTIPVSAVVPSSQKSEAERQVTGKQPGIGNGSLDADLRAQALKTELAKANIQLEEARKLKEQADKARLEIEQATAARIQAERAHLAQEAEQARQAVEEARRLKTQLEQAKREVQKFASQARDKESEELRTANLQLEEAHRVKLEAEKARVEMERELRERLAIEQARLAAEAEAERQRLEAEAAALRTQLEAEHHTAKLLAIQAREQESVNANTVSAQLEEVQRLKSEAEAARLDLERAAEQRLQEEKARIAAEAERAQAALAEAQRLKEEAELARLSAARDAENRLREQQEKLAAEADQARLAWEEAQRLKAQIEAEKQSAEAAIALQREQALAELKEANSRLEAAQRARAEAEEARIRLEKEAAEKIAEEQARLAAEAAQAQRTWEDAQRLKEQIEIEKRRADEEAAERRREEEARIQQMRDDAEQRLREEERKLEESYAWQAEELARLQRMKEEAEEQLVLERARLKSETEDARSRLAEAHRIQSEVEQARMASAQEAEQRQQRQIELERRLRDEMQAKVDGERRKLEAEFARNAEELERAQREKAAAEAARNAAADEAERIIQEFKKTHQEQREREEEKLSRERERLELEAAQLRASLEQAKHAQEQAALVQKRLEAQLQETVAARAGDHAQHSAIAASLSDNIASMEAEVSAARANAAAAEAAHKRVQVAARMNLANLEQHRQEEGAIRTRFEQEIQSWLSEQDEVQNSQLTKKVFASQRAHMERIKQRAQAARNAAKAHDQALIEDLATRLRED